MKYFIFVFVGAGPGGAAAGAAALLGFGGGAGGGCGRKRGSMCTPNSGGAQLRDYVALLNQLKGYGKRSQIPSGS